MLGLWLNPSKKWTSSLMSFGAGALIAALTLELVHESLQIAGFAPLGIGCITGALLFMLLNHLLDNQGGFLRKLSTTVAYLRGQKIEKAESILDNLSTVGILRELPPEEIHTLIPMLHPVAFKKSSTIFNRGDAGDRLYIVEAGELEVVQGGRSNDAGIAKLGPGDVFGEMALVHDAPRSALVRALSDVKTFALDKKDFDKLMSRSGHLRQAVTLLGKTRKEELDRISKENEKDASETWAGIAKDHLQGAAVVPTQYEIKEAHKEHGGAAFAIWLGILLDGIPESLVIGASMIGKSSVSMSLIVGVFLANFPEALSSAVGMRRQGSSITKIMSMWIALMLMTGVGAFIGNATFRDFPPSLFVVIQGAAAGAMLAMIAETMLPEAAEQGGPANGLMTVLGFLSAIFVGVVGGGH
jgi:zinc transporter ZupT